MNNVVFYNDISGRHYDLYKRLLLATMQRYGVAHFIYQIIKEDVKTLLKMAKDTCDHINL